MNESSGEQPEMSTDMHGSINKKSEVSTGKTRVTCPYCFSVDTEFYSLFGQQLLTMQYYCNTCHTPFEYIKDDDYL
jgi:DNA-directed RNA polymerase subunit RPC12/RpoP